MASVRHGPLYHPILSDLVTRFSPKNPEIGMNYMFSSLNPSFLRKLVASALISLNLASSYGLAEVLSILLTQTMMFLIPRVKAKRACSLVCPSEEIPASNSP